MKRLFGIIVLIFVLIASSSIFIHFSNCLIEPSSADKYNSYFKKWDRAIVDFCMHHEQMGSDYMNKCFEMFDDSTPTDSGHRRKCSDTCPLPRTRGKRLVKTASRLKKGNFIEIFHASSNIAGQSGIRD